MVAHNLVMELPSRPGRPVCRTYVAAPADVPASRVVPAAAVSNLVVFVPARAAEPGPGITCLGDGSTPGNLPAGLLGAAGICTGLTRDGWVKRATVQVFRFKRNRYHRRCTAANGPVTVRGASSYASGAGEARRLVIRWRRQLVRYSETSALTPDAAEVEPRLARQSRCGGNGMRQRSHPSQFHTIFQEVNWKIRISISDSPTTHGGNCSRWTHLLSGWRRIDAGRGSVRADGQQVSGGQEHLLAGCWCVSMRRSCTAKGNERVLMRVLKALRPRSSERASAARTSLH